jgi:hypothetical protein
MTGLSSRIETSTVDLTTVYDHCYSVKEGKVWRVMYRGAK